MGRIRGLRDNPHFLHEFTQNYQYIHEQIFLLDKINRWKVNLQWVVVILIKISMQGVILWLIK